MWQTTLIEQSANYWVLVVYTLADTQYLQNVDPIRGYVSSNPLWQEPSQLLSKSWLLAAYLNNFIQKLVRFFQGTCQKILLYFWWIFLVIIRTQNVGQIWGWLAIVLLALTCFYYIKITSQHNFTLLDLQELISWNLKHFIRCLF